MKILAFLIIAVASLNSGFAQESSDQVATPVYQDALAVARNYRPVVGEPHPDFILPSIADPEKRIQLSDFRGKKVLLLHFASW